MDSNPQAAKPGMSVAQARRVEYTIVGISILALALIFQPFSLTLYSAGAGLIIFAGLAFNLVPLCVAGRPVSSLVKGAVPIERNPVRNIDKLSADINKALRPLP